MLRRGHAWVAALFLLYTSYGYAAEVVVYTSVDQEYAEPVLKQFEKKNGIQVKAIYDAEAAKTVGLERRLLAEKNRPKADVFWNSEHLRTLRLETEGVLANTTRNIKTEIPSGYQSAQGSWLGFGMRARVLLINTQQIAEANAPQKLEELTHPRWKGKVAIAKPYFGTTATHFAALYVSWGKERFIRFLQALKANQVALLPGNGDVRDAVVNGRYAFGLTDTDDALSAIRHNKPVKLIFPDQDADGAFTVFHTVSAIKGGPNPAQANKLVQYLTSSTVEDLLIRSGAVQLPVHANVAAAQGIVPAPKTWQLSGKTLLSALNESAKLVRDHLE